MLLLRISSCCLARRILRVPEQLHHFDASGEETPVPSRSITLPLVLKRHQLKCHVGCFTSRTYGHMPQSLKRRPHQRYANWPRVSRRINLRINAFHIDSINCPPYAKALLYQSDYSRCMMFVRGTAQLRHSSVAHQTCQKSYLNYRNRLRSSAKDSSVGRFSSDSRSSAHPFPRALKCFSSRSMKIPFRAQSWSR